MITNAWQSLIAGLLIGCTIAFLTTLICYAVLYIQERRKRNKK